MIYGEVRKMTKVEVGKLREGRVGGMREREVEEMSNKGIVKIREIVRRKSRDSEGKWDVVELRGNTGSTGMIGE